MKKPYQKTMYACFIGYIVQAIVNNFVPLLFVTFQTDYRVPLQKITLLITVNFLIQLCVDLLSAGFIDRIGYRASVLLAHGFAAAGLILLTILPDRTADPFEGILLAVVVYALGGGLLEVLVSPILEACPTDNKASAMSLLHSFYCWGQMGVVLLSTLFFTVFGIANWKALALVWAAVPILNGVLFATAPIYPLNPEGGAGLTLKELCRNKVFWLLMLMMLGAGAAENTVSQWASAFAEEGLGVTKTVGDLAGPMAFAALMGTARLIYGKWGHKLHLEKCMLGSSLLCVAAYLAIALVPDPRLALVGCAVCGFAVGILWPGTFSKGAAAIPKGGTAMFALFALAGDLGCSAGPTLAGMVTRVCDGNMRRGILAGIVFPLLLVLCLVFGKKRKAAAGNAQADTNCSHG